MEDMISFVISIDAISIHAICMDYAYEMPIEWERSYPPSYNPFDIRW